jgi:hypothetical protein
LLIFQSLKATLVFLTRTILRLSGTTLTVINFSVPQGNPSFPHENDTKTFGNYINKVKISGITLVYILPLTLAATIGYIIGNFVI